MPDNPMENSNEIPSAPEEPNTIFNEIKSIFTDLNLSISPELEEEFKNFEVSTLIRIKSVFILVKSLSEMHQTIQLEMTNFLSKSSNSNNINNMMEQLAENLRKLEETRVKELISDILKRYLNKEFPIPENPSLDNIKFTSLQDLQNFIIIKKDDKETKENVVDSIPLPERSDSGEDQEYYQTLLQNKNEKISQLEDEVQLKIRDLEALKSDLSRFNELDDEVHSLRKRNSDLESENQNQKTEYSILTNENKLFQTRIQEISDQLEKTKLELTAVRQNSGDLSTLQEKIQEYENSTKQYLEDKKQLEEINLHLQEKIDQLEHSHQDLKNEISQVKNQNQDLRGSVELKESRIQDLDAENQSKHQEIVKLRDALDNVQSNNEGVSIDFSAQLDEKELIISDLKQELHDLNGKIQNMIFKDDFNALSRKFEDQEQILVQKNQYIQEKTNEIQQITKLHQDEKEELLSKIESLQEKVSHQENLEEQLREKDEIIDDYQKQEEEFHEALLGNVKLTAEKEELNEKIKELISQKEVLFERISDLKRENNGHKAIIIRLKKQAEELESKVKQEKPVTPEDIKDSVEKEFLRKQVDSLNAELREQIVLASEANGKFQVIQDQLDQTKKELKEIQDKYDFMSQDYNNLERKIRELKVNHSQNYAELEQKYKVSERKVGELETQLLRAQDSSQYQVEIDELKRKLEEKTLKAQEFHDDLQKAEAEMKSSKGEIMRLNDEIVNLKRRIKILRRDLSQQPSEL